MESEPQTEMEPIKFKFEGWICSKKIDREDDHGDKKGNENEN